MQASNSNNEFNGPEKILMINISPAFWNTWWFRMVAAIFVLGIFYLVSTLPYTTKVQTAIGTL